MDIDTFNALWAMDARQMDRRRAINYHRRKRHQAAMRRHGKVRFVQGAALMAAVLMLAGMAWR